jgi:hypothetical protein
MPKRGLLPPVDASRRHDDDDRTGRGASCTEIVSRVLPIKRDQTQHSRRSRPFHTHARGRSTTRNSRSGNRQIHQIVSDRERIVAFVKVFGRVDGRGSARAETMRRPRKFPSRGVTKYRPILAACASCLPYANVSRGDHRIAGCHFARQCVVSGDSLV